MFDFEGGVALITGAAKGLGAGLARAFFAAGSSVVIADIDGVAGTALAEELRAIARRDQRAVFRGTDITDDAQLKLLVQGIRRDFGRLDAIVNNACVYSDGGLGSDRRAWHQSWDVNVVSGALLVHAARSLLAKASNPSVVNMSSIAGKIGQRGRLLYPACKAALLQVTRSQAVELAADRIRVNAVSPAWTWSEAMERQVAGERRIADEVAAQLHPIGRVGEAVDIANAVLFLCSAQARHVTGIDLPVDGGYAVLGPDQGFAPAHWFDQARRRGQSSRAD